MLHWVLPVKIMISKYEGYFLMEIVFFTSEYKHPNRTLEENDFFEDQIVLSL